MKFIDNLILAPVLASLAGPAFAGRPVEVSEPGILALLGLAGVGVAIAIIRKWRK